MPYTPTTWVDKVTKLGPTNLNKLELGVQAAATAADTALPTFNVKAAVYGAVGDGAHDDTTNIQAAINAASAAGGGIVFFPRGQYLITASLTIPSFVTLQGVGGVFRSTEYGINPTTFSSQIVGPTVTTFDMLKNSDSVNGNTAITIRGLWIGPGSSTTADIKPILFNKVRRSLIYDCYIRNEVTPSRYGLHHTGISEHNTVHLCQFEGAGIVHDTGNNLRILTCEIDQGGIIITGGFGHIVSQCDVDQFGIGLGVAFAAYPNGIYLNGCVNSQVTGNQVVSARQWGIQLASCTHCQVVGNESKNNSQQTSTTWGSFNLDTFSTACTDNVVVGNSFMDIQGSPTQAYGFAVQSSAAGTTRNVIVGNTCKGNLTKPGIVTAPLPNLIRLNTSYVTEAGGVSTQTPGAVTTVNIPHGLTVAPTFYNVNPGSANARGAPAFHVTADATNVILTFASVLTGATVYVWVWSATV